MEDQLLVVVKVKQLLITGKLFLIILDLLVHYMKKSGKKLKEKDYFGYSKIA